MRGDLESIVWAAECHPKIRSWKFTLLNLCYHANSEGVAYPSTSVIARETGYTKRAVIDALDGLEAAGIICRVGGCGHHNRVVRYLLTGILTSVHNLANGEMSSPLKNLNGEVSSKKESLNGEVSSVNGEVSSPRSILGNKKVSKLVCAGVNGEVSSPFVHNGQKGGGSEGSSVAPSARNEGRPPDEYRAKVRTPGWKPKTDADRRACAALVFRYGANSEQSQKFVRYNAIRRWTCCDFGTVNDAAKQWVEAWRESEPEAFWAERSRRKAR